LTCSGIDELPSFPRASTISSSSSFVVEDVFRKSGAVPSFKMGDPVLFVFGSHVLYSRDLFLGRVTSPSAKSPFLKDQFVSLSLDFLLRSLRLGMTYQEHKVPAGIARKFIEAGKHPPAPTATTWSHSECIHNISISSFENQ